MTHRVSSAAGLHVRYEKAGLILDALPVPQGVDAVIVEANVRLPARSPHEKQDFTLQWATQEKRCPAELLLTDKDKKFLRVFFRVGVPEASTRAVVRWREHLLGEIDVPVVLTSTLIENFDLAMPSVHASLSG